MRARLDARALPRRTPAPASAGLPSPDAVDVGHRRLRVGDAWCTTLAVSGYPADVGPGWLEPLLTYSGAVDVAVHVEGLPAPVAAERLRRHRGRLESTRRVDDQRGRLVDPAVEVAAADAAELAARLARGEGRLFRVGLYVTVWATGADALDAEAARVRSLLASLLLDAHPATFRSLQGWLTTCPFGVDLLRMRRTFDTAALAAAFPFASAELASTDGVLVGRNLQSRGLVFWDRFAQANHNTVILARSGAGKSYLAKLDALRSLYAGVEVAIIDPEAEYRRLAEVAGGAYVHLGAPGVRLNPFDVGTECDALTRRALFVHTLVAVLAGERLDPATTAALDRAILAAYESRGISADPRTHGRPAPVLADLTAALSVDGDPAATLLAARLAPWVSGTHRQLFDGQTTTRVEGRLVVFSLRDLPAELKGPAMLVVLDALWRRVIDPDRSKRRLVVIDEAWVLLRDPEGARFCHRLAKSARKYRCGLTTITQDPADLLGTEMGQAVVANAATQVLLRQAPQAADVITDAFGLSAGERAFLLGARQGEGILVGGDDQAVRVGFSALASPAEHEVAVTGLAADEELAQ